MTNGNGLIKLFTSVIEFDIAETLLGIIILYFDFKAYTEVYFGFEGKANLGFILSVMLISGFLFFVDGFSRWKERYEEKREYEREQHKKRMESIKNPPAVFVQTKKLNNGNKLN